MSANSIHQSTPVAQADLSQNGEEISIISVSKASELLLGLTPLQRDALFMYDIGLNVFPQPFGEKSGFPWQRLQFTRLSRKHHRFNLLRLFAGSCNLAVMCGRTSGNLFVIDCESKASFEMHVEAVRLSGIPLWAVRSSRGGHIYMRAMEGEVDNITPGTIEDVEVRGRNGYVIAPPSLHPSGDAYDWYEREGDEPPIVSIEDVNWLQNAQGEQVSLAIATYPTTADDDPLAQGPLSNLSNATRQYLDEGQFVPEGNRNNSLFNAACDLAGNGVSQEEAELLLLTPAITSGLTQDECLRTIRSAYSRPRQPARPDTGRKLTGEWYYVLVWASHQPWSGRTGGTARSAMMALIERCRKGGNPVSTFRASVREIAEISRIGPNTVSHRLRDFTKGDTPILLRRGQDKMSKANVWAFNEAIVNEGRRIALSSADHPVSAEWRVYLNTLLNADAAESGILGHTGAFVYRHMTQDGQARPASEWVDIIGISRGQFYYNVKKMAKHGLIVHADNQYRAINYSDAELDQVVDAPPKGDMRRERFAEERAAFAGQLLFEARRQAEKGQFLGAAIRVRPEEIKVLDDFAFNRNLFELARAVADVDPERDIKQMAKNGAKERAAALIARMDAAIEDERQRRLSASEGAQRLQLPAPGGLPQPTSSEEDVLAYIKGDIPLLPSGNTKPDVDADTDSEK